MSAPLKSSAIKVEKNQDLPSKETKQSNTVESDLNSKHEEPVETKFYTIIRPDGSEHEECDHQLSDYLSKNEPNTEELMFLDSTKQMIITLQHLKPLSKITALPNPKLSASFMQYLEKCKRQDAGILEEIPNSHALVQNSKIDEELLKNIRKMKQKSKFKQMQKFKKKLPIYKKREEILDLIENNQVLVLNGQTGSGKTTQVPQYILDFYIQSNKGSLCNVLCAQLRRISTVAVAERVAEERCVPCGGNQDVGYRIRLEKKNPRKQGSILFCTTGVILRELQNKPYLSGFSHLIIDDVSEHDMITDFFLLLLRDVLMVNKDLKVILMGATIDNEKFSHYFGDCPVIEVPSEVTYNVQIFTLEDMIEKTGFRIGRQPKRFQTRLNVKLPNDPEYIEKKQDYLKNIGPKYSCPTIEALTAWNEGELNLDLILQMICFINSQSTEGTILIFLPGWQEIETLCSLIRTQCSRAQSMFHVIPLHSKTSSQYQQQILKKAPNGKRKIILATNIAETSITIEDCAFVIDSGLIKTKTFDPVRNLDVLKPQLVSLSNVTQRRGRVGRTQPGVVYHMFTKLTESLLAEYPVPEMQRSSLEQYILDIKILKRCGAASYFEKAIHPPKPEAVEVSLAILRELDAITDDEKLTPLGFLLAKIPADVHVGKMLLYGVIFSCLDPILSIAASLSFRDPFIMPIGKPSIDFFNQRMIELANGTQSDQLLITYALEQWELAYETYDTEEAWKCARNNFLSYTSLVMMYNLKYEYTNYLNKLGFLGHSDPVHQDYNHNSGNVALIKAIISAAFYSNVVKVHPRDKQKTGDLALKAITKNKEEVTVFPKSVNAFVSHIETGWLAYHTKMKSTKVYIHDTTAISVNSLLLFGTDLKGIREGDHYALLVDKWIQVNGSEDEVKLILYLRQRLDNVLKEKISNPSYTNWNVNSKDIRVLKCAVEFLS